MNAGEAIIRAVKTKTKQDVLVNGKRCFIAAQATRDADQPLRVTFTTRVVNETPLDAKKRLTELAFDIKALFDDVYPAKQWRAFLPDNDAGGFSEAEKNGAKFCAMFWGIERRGRWANY